MTTCNGNGECLEQCWCSCYNEETDEYDEICTCGHREHKGNCPSACCIPVECRNYKYCNVKQAQWVSDCHNGMCLNCAVQLGPHETTNIIENCPVCLENKNIIILKCNHKICSDCWYKITELSVDEDTEKSYKTLCPLCRNLNDWSK
jgi:hypothetical protein